MPAINYSFAQTAAYLGESAALNMINEEIIVASGAGVVKPGTVLGKITASGKYLPHDPAAADGSQNAAAILFSKVDATSADAKSVATVRGPATIFDPMLIYKTGISGANKLAAQTALRAKGLAILPQHAS